MLACSLIGGSIGRESALAAKHPKLHHLNWNLLRTFLVIAEERSITGAANRLKMQQPTITAALKRLEETLDCQLVLRSSRQFSLTKRGELLQKECVEILRMVTRIGDKLSEDHDELTGLVSIQSITHVVLPPLDRALTAMSRRHASVSIRIDIASSQDIVRSVSQKMSPFGICLLPNPLAGLSCRLLLREDFGIFCGREHALYGRNHITLEDMKDEPFVALSCGQDGALEPMVSLREGAGLGSRTIGSSPHLEEVARMITAGVGIGILPIASVQHAVQSGILWNLASPADRLGANLYLISNPVVELTPAEAAFRSLFDAELATHDLERAASEITRVS